MIFREFIVWAQTAPLASRVHAASVLARAWLEADLSPQERVDADLALTFVLDDPGASVRRALAIEFSAAPAAPAHIVAALATDQSEVSVPVLSRSPLLCEAQLCEAAVIGDVYAQAAIALRPGLPEAVAWTLADRGGREAVISLAVNQTAEVSEQALRRAIERFGEDGEVREAILGRHGLPDSVRCELMAATARALSNFVLAAGWMSSERIERTCREATEAGSIEIAGLGTSQESGDLPIDLVRHLRLEGQLTPAFLLRALLSGNRTILEAALSELAAQPAERTRAFVAAWSGAGFGALFARAGMPASLLPVFRAALAAQDEYGIVYAAGRRPQLSRLLVDATTRALDTMAGPDLGRVTALLNRLRAEAVRAESRALTAELGAARDCPALTAPASGGVQIDLEALEARINVAA